jgi:hypothetical protein
VTVSRRVDDDLDPPRRTAPVIERSPGMTSALATSVDIVAAPRQ